MFSNLMMGINVIAFVLLFCQTVIASSHYTGSAGRQASSYSQCRHHVAPMFGFPAPVGNITSTRPLRPSGLAHSRQFSNVLYFVNDNGLGNAVFILDANTARIIGSINITDATNVDWEAVAVGVCPAGLTGTCIYVQDAGSRGPGPVNVIYVIREPQTATQHIRKTADRIIRYKLRPGTSLRQSNGIFVDCQGNVLFFDRLLGGRGVQLFRIDATNTAIAEAVRKIDLPTVPFRSSPRGLSLSSDCCELLVKTIDKVYYYPILNGEFQDDGLRVLPYFPGTEEEGIAWDLTQNRYYVVSDLAPHTLRVAERNRNVPTEKFGLGRTAGIIGGNAGDILTGLAGSRKNHAFVYVARETGFPTILIVQVFQAQTVGAINVNLQPNNLLQVYVILDIATGRCPSSFSGSSCIYIITSSFRSSRILIIKEPENLFAVTTVNITASNMLTLSQGVNIISIMIGSNGDIFGTSRVPRSRTVMVIKLNTEGANATAVTIANFTTTSADPVGPGAADISPCFNEILIKFADMVLLFDLKDNNVADAFSRSPSFLPYITETNGRAVTFLDCDTYLTTTAFPGPKPLMMYRRVPYGRAAPHQSRVVHQSRAPQRTAHHQSKLYHQKKFQDTFPTIYFY